jgi:hypothetical protein
MGQALDLRREFDESLHRANLFRTSINGISGKSLVKHLPAESSSLVLHNSPLGKSNICSPHTTKLSSKLESHNGHNESE